MTPADVASAFIHAVAWGEHHDVWSLLGREGRHSVVRIATNRGLDPAVAARLRDGTALPAERDVFLADLVNGLRNDLIGIDLDTLGFVDDPAPEPDRCRVILTTPMPAALDPAGGLPVASVELALEGDRWRVERLLPRPGSWPQ